MLSLAKPVSTQLALRGPIRSIGKLKSTLTSLAPLSLVNNQSLTPTLRLQNKKLISGQKYPTYQIRPLVRSFHTSMYIAD